jgi:hypothetical protein
MQKLKALEAAIEASLDKRVSLTDPNMRIGAQELSRVCRRQVEVTPLVGRLIRSPQSEGLT